MGRGTPERRLLSSGTQWTRELFQPFCFFLSINLLLRRGSCSVPRAPAFERALVHSWPRTIMLEISRRHRTLPIAPALLLADPLSASRALKVIFCPKACYCGMLLSGTVGTLLITLDRLDNNSLCVKHCSSLKVDCYHSSQQPPLVGIRIPISQVSVGERKWLADGLNNFCLPKLKKTQKSPSLPVYRKPLKSLWPLIYSSVIRDSQAVNSMVWAEWVQELVSVKTDCHSFTRKSEKPKYIRQIGSEKLK